jgi:hypothetical protein
MRQTKNESRLCSRWPVGELMAGLNPSFTIKFHHSSEIFGGTARG